MKKIFLLLTILAALHAEAQFTGSGTIEFERRYGVQRYQEDYNKSFFNQIKNQIPKNVIRHFTLRFNADRTLYAPVKDEEVVSSWWSSGPASENVVYTDLTAQRILTSKQVFEERFQISDSVRHTDWKLLPEVRTIAGFSCRKAVGRICDSVYVVAFYADALPVSGGPELFGGLPGIILEIAIPRLYCTWTATRVEAVPQPDIAYKPGKGRSTDQKGFYGTLLKSFSDWGESKDRNLWWSVL